MVRCAIRILCYCVFEMWLSLVFRILGLGFAAMCLSAQSPDAQVSDQQTHGPRSPGPANEAQGLPPRAAPSDYPTQAKLGPITLAAEFAGHALPTLDGPLSTDDYLVVEVAFYGPAGQRLALSFNDFALRINHRKNPSSSEPFERVGQSVKDPEWAPPEKEEKSKTSIGGGGSNDSSKEPPKPPLELRRAWAQRVKKAAFADGERPLPQAGLLYFPYGGKVAGIRSLELIYSGPAGKATLDLQP
jgi:hypothetical protein